MDLLSLIGNTEWAAFEHAYRTRQAVSRPETVHPERFHPLWSGWELDAICRFTFVPHLEGFRLFSRGRKVGPETYLDGAGALREDVMRKLWSSGVSIALANLEDYSNRTLALTRGLESVFRCPVQANLYTTPGLGQGLGAHSDAHDVLVLQVQGRKTWNIFPPDNKANAGLRSTPNGPSPSPAEMTLLTGGWLFLPKGIQHEVRNKAAEPSIHLTVGFHPMTWANILQRALDTARASDPALEEGCPAGASIGDAPDRIRSQLLSILPYVETPNRYYEGFANLGQSLPASDVVPDNDLSAADASTDFVWNKNAVLAGGEVLELSLDYRRNPLRLRPEIKPAIVWMIQAGVFRPSHIPMESAETAVLLCKFLADAGVLRFAPPLPSDGRGPG